jgi:hypothetical protein
MAMTGLASCKNLFRRCGCERGEAGRNRWAPSAAQDRQPGPEMEARAGPGGGRPNSSFIKVRTNTLPSGKHNLACCPLSLNLSVSFCSFGVCIEYP